MRIVIVNKGTGLKIAGMGVYAESLETYLERRGHEVFEFRFSKKRSYSPKVISIPYYYAEHRSIVIVPSLSSISKIETNLRRIRPDIVYINFATSTLDFILPKMCHKLGIPVAAVWHGDYYSSALLYRLTFKLPFNAYLSACKELDMLQVFSSRIRDYFLDKGLSSDKIAVIPNGVDTATYSPGASKFAKKKRMEMGILFLGRMAGVKNPELLINSYLKLKDPGGVKLVMVGDGEKLADLRKMYQQERIVFLGEVEDLMEKIDIIRSCQIFVLPSKFEGMSLALLEAMSCGLACIASDVGTNGEVLRGVGRVIPYQKLRKNLPLELEKLINNPKEVKKLGKAARKKVEEKYVESRTFLKLEETLLQTIKKFEA